LQIGVVEGIVGILDCEITIEGFANHAGTTPMKLRKDALLAASKLIVGVNEVINSVPGNQVGTVGKIQAQPGAYNVVPGKVILGLEIRDLSWDKIEMLLNEIEKHGVASTSSKKGVYDLGLSLLPDLTKDNTDRNRTSPFAFTGNKFEFRAVGASQSPAFPATVLNTIVAESVNEMVDEIEEALGSDKSKQAVFNATLGVVQKFLKGSKNVRYSGDNYSHDWIEEAARRGLPNLAKCIEAFPASGMLLSSSEKAMNASLGLDRFFSTGLSASAITVATSSLSFMAFQHFCYNFNSHRMLLKIIYYLLTDWF
jgi:hypothetical protein